MKLVTYEYPKVSGIDITSFNYYGGVSGYDVWKEMSSLTFRLKDPSKSDEVYQMLLKACPYSEEDKHVKIKTTFEDYQKDKRPVIILNLFMGSRGFKDGIQFRFEED